MTAYGCTMPLYLGTTVVNEQILIARDSNKSKDRDKTSIIFLARVEKVKGIYELIDSFHQLQKRYPRITLDIAGVGGELQNAKEYVARKNILNVDFHGLLNGNHKSNMLQKAHIYLLPSWHGEGMPNSLLEAMASGLAIITTEI
ncbi:MAG: glycosyltransferase family 4 protein [Saprospiraceae bacterium]|nr:glycosyltransferase family 4 protein [Saprospiraceae bacterium]